MNKEALLNKLGDMYTRLEGIFGIEVNTLEEIREEVEYILGDYEDVPDSPPYMRKLIIDVDRVYADVLLNIITQYKHPSAKNRIFPLEIVTRICTLSSVKYYRSWEDIMERVSKLEEE